MEPTMIKLKVLSTVAAIALVLPIAAPSASFAQQFKGGKGGVAVGGGRGAPAARFSGGGAPMARFSGGWAPRGRGWPATPRQAAWGAPRPPARPPPRVIGPPVAAAPGRREGPRPSGAPRPPPGAA